MKQSIDYERAETLGHLLEGMTKVRYEYLQRAETIEDMLEIYEDVKADLMWRMELDTSKEMKIAAIKTFIPFMEVIQDETANWTF